MTDRTKPVETGYEAFKAFIDSTAADLGGSPNVRIAVATLCQEALIRAMSRRRGIGPYDLPHFVGWTLADADDFEAGVVEARGTSLRPRLSIEPVREARWRGGLLVQRGGTIRLEGASGAMDIAHVGEGRTKTDRWTREVVGETIQVSLTDSAKLAMYGSRMPPTGKPSYRHASSGAGADRTLVAIVSEFFRVEFTNVEPAEGHAAVGEPGAEPCPAP